LIRLVIGFIANMAILETIEIISLVIGVVFWILGSMGCQVGGPGSAPVRYQGPGWAGRWRWCQRVMATLRAFVSAARPKVS
jgi:hypothetical protein